MVINLRKINLQRVVKYFDDGEKNLILKHIGSLIIMLEILILK